MVVEIYVSIPDLSSCTTSFSCSFPDTLAYLSLHHPGIFLPQDLCVCCSRCLSHSSPRDPITCQSHGSDSRPLHNGVAVAFEGCVFQASERPVQTCVHSGQTLEPKQPYTGVSTVSEVIQPEWTGHNLVSFLVTEHICHTC
jgi:hypothetical protein